jgi:phospholipase/carboxylesterase
MATSLLLKNENYTLPPTMNYDSLHQLISNAFHARRPNPRVVFDSSLLEDCAQDNIHKDIPTSVSGCPLSSETELCVVCVHGRYASADVILKQLEDIIGLQAASSKTTIIAPQARGSSWYHGSFLLPWEENQPGIQNTMEVIDSCVQKALVFVPASRILLFGFSQGACSVLSYVVGPKAPTGLGGVIALSGGLCGSDDEVSDVTRYPASALTGVSVILGCSEQDSHVPQERVQKTTTILERLGHATVICDLYPGADHKIFDTSATKVRSFFNSLKAKVNSAQNLRDPFKYLHGYMGILE